jgi:bifunctional enzyme CysN/CysC
MANPSLARAYAAAFTEADQTAEPARPAPVPVERAETLRFLTCGSVDDGKSTLIGRLLYDARQIYDDQLAALQRDSSRFGTTGDEIDFALLTDGLEAERSQGITIDVAYRFFSTGRRSFIVADTPGHEQYTRNMATGASTADLAVILIDARKGILPQTRRHAFICSLLGIHSVVLAVNKIDLMPDKEATFRAIAQEFAAFSEHLGFAVTAIPISARYGDNVGTRSTSMPWYDGPTLVEHLETVEPPPPSETSSFRFPVQWVNRPDADFRGYSGTIRGGRIELGDPVVEAVSGRTTRIEQIIGADGERAAAQAGEAVTLVLADQIDLSRGDVLCCPGDQISVADQFSAHLIWMADQPLLAGREYLLKIGTRTVPATVTAIRHTVDIEHFNKLASTQVRHNEIAFCNFSTSFPIAFDAYKHNRQTGGFILIDRLSNATVGAGMIEVALRRASNLHLQKVTIDSAARAALLGQKPAVLWFTGLSGAGKSTIADLVERRLHAAGQLTYLLDGDNIRHGLNRDLGFTEADRVENIRRVGELSKLMTDAGLVVLCCFISPFARERQMVRELLGETAFLEVFVETSLKTCISRDPKGLYAKAQRGEIRNFTGFDSPYEEPANPEIRLKTEGKSPEELADLVIEQMAKHGLLRQRSGR